MKLRLSSGKAVAVSAGLCLALAACGGSGSGTSGGGTGSGASATPSSAAPSGGGLSTSKPATLSVATPTVVPGTFSQVYLAQELGYYKDENLTVNIKTGVARSTLSLITSGQVDLAVFGATAALTLRAQGKDAKVLYNLDGGGQLANVAVKANSPIKSLNQLAGKSVGATTPTGAQGGWTNLLSSKVQKATGKGFKIDYLGSETVLVNSLETGAIAAAVVPKSFVTPDIDSGKLRLLVDTTKSAERQKYLGLSNANDTEGCIFGINSDLTAKKNAVTRFFVALNRANTYLNTHSGAQVGAVLARMPVFKQAGAKTLGKEIATPHPYFNQTHGLITSSNWQASLDIFKKWGKAAPPNVATDSKYSYAQAVDMSYLKAALAAK